jgi:hypothetical protein
MTVYFAVSLEAFLWGAGTAIGELPPYFVARAASMAGGTSEELEELLEEAKTDDSWMSKMKMSLFRFVKKNAFITVLLAASVGDPSLIILDSQPFVRPGWPDLWPSLNPFPSVFCGYLHWQSCQQSFNPNRIHHHSFQQAFDK